MQLHLLSFAFLANIVAVRERKKQMNQCPCVLPSLYLQAQVIWS